MVAYLKLVTKMRRGRFAERGRRLLDQVELQLEELEAKASKDEATAGQAGTPDTNHY
jgi:hypothetical protein